MFNKNLEYIIKEVPTEDRQALQDLLNEMSMQGWDLYTLHEVESEDDILYSCIFMKERSENEENEVFDKVVNIKNFKSQMEKMLSKQISPYESCKEITEKIREQKKRVADIKSEIEKVDWSDRGTLNDQMSGALRRLEELKQDLVKEISPGVMYSRIGEEKFTVNLSEELIDFVSPDNKDDLLSETVKSRQKLTDELGYVIPRMVFQDEEELEPYQFSIKVHGLEVFKSMAIPEHTAFFKEELNIRKPANTIVDKDVISGKEVWWIDNNLAEDYWANGYSAVEYIARAVEFVSIKHVAELLDYNDINHYLMTVEQRNPFVVNNIIPDFITLSELKYILINLIREKISIKDIDYVFEKINDFSDELTKDSLLDKIRLSLSKHISQRFIGETPTEIIELSGETLDKMFKLTDTEEETVIKVDGKFAEKLAKKALKVAKDNGLDEVIIIVPIEIRHMTFAIFSEFINNLTIVAHEELSCETNVHVIATI